MVRRTVTFLVAIMLIAGVASLVYFNSQPTTLRWAPNHETTMPLAWLIVGSTIAGAALGFLILIAREGHWALRQWKLVRALRAAENAAARRSEAKSSVLAGRHAKARTLLAKTASGPGAVIDDAVDYGEAFLAEGRAAEGRTHLEDARRELGDDPRILYALARCCCALDDKAGAVAALDRAVEALPSSVTLWSLLRDCLVSLEWWPRAEVAQQRIVDLHPGDPDEKTRLVEIRMKTAENADDADRETALRGVLAMDPSWPAAAAARGLMLDSQGRKWAATRVLYKAAKRRPADETLRALDTVLENGSSRRLLRLYSRLRRANPASSELALHHAALLIRLGKGSEAEEVLRGLEGATGREAAIVESLRARIMEGHSDPAAVADALRRALDRSLES